MGKGVSFSSTKKSKGDISRSPLFSKETRRVTQSPSAVPWRAFSESFREIMFSQRLVLETPVAIEENKSCGDRVGCAESKDCL